MPVIKEFRCLAAGCGADFESLVPVCEHCGSREVKRVFLTPPGINGGATTRGSAKAIDNLLAREFAKQNIADFSNCRGENRVRYKRRVAELGRGVYGTAAGGMAQPPIKAFIGAPGDFSQPARDPLGYGLNSGALPSGLPFQNVQRRPEELTPTIDQGGSGNAVNMVEHARSTPLPDNLRRRTQVVKRPRE